MKISSEEARQRLDGLPDLLSHHIHFLAEGRELRLSEQIRGICQKIDAEEFQEALELCEQVMFTLCELYRERLEQTIKGRGFPEELIAQVKSQIPEAGSVAALGVNANLITALALFPEQKGLIAEARMKDSSEFYDLARKGFSSLGNPPEFDANSPLTWHLSADSLQVAQVDTRNFLERLARFQQLREDPEARLEHAHSLYAKWANRIAANNFFGPDIPFQAFDSFADSVTAYVIPTLMGHDVSVSYLRKEGLYLIAAYPTKIDFDGFSFSQHAWDLPLSETQTYSAPIGPLPIPDQAGRTGSSKHLVVAIDREEAKRAVEHLRQTGQITFRTVQRQTARGLDFRDPFENRIRYQFLGRTCPDPLYAVAIYDLTARAEPLALQPDGRQSSERTSQTIKDGVRIYLSSESGVPIPGNGKLGLELSQRLGDRDWAEVQKSIARVQGARMVIWNNGRASIILNKSFKFPADILLREEDREPGQKYGTFWGWQTFSSRNDINAFSGPPDIPQGNKRFGRPPLRLDYDTLGHLELHVPVNRQKLEFAYDPALKEHGFPEKFYHGQLVNCLTNYGDYSIPLRRPTDREFSMREFKSIRALSAIPQGSWSRVVRAIRGRYIEAIADILIDPKAMGETEGRSGVKDDIVDPGITPRSEEFYQGPAKGVIPSGTWIIFHCQRGDQHYYVADSPEPVFNAIYVFRTLEAAKHWTEYFQNPGPGRKRTDALKDLDCIGRVIHFEDYLENLELLLDRKLLRVNPSTLVKPAIPI